MNKLNLALSALFMLAMVVVMAPNVLAINRGHILRNIALWLAIFVGLGLIYENFGPGSAHPLFRLPESMAAHNLATLAPAEADSSGSTGDKADDTAHSFIPPKE